MGKILPSQRFFTDILMNPIVFLDVSCFLLESDN